MAIIPAVAAAIAAAVAAAKQQRQQLRQLQQSQQITVIATRSYQHQHHTSTSSISSSCISYINISSSSWCYWCFTGVGKTNACSKSTIRPRNSNGSCCNNNRMGKKVLPAPVQVHAKLLVVNFALVLAPFQNTKPDEKTKSPDKKRYLHLQAKKQKLNKIQMQQEEKTI